MQHNRLMGMGRKETRLSEPLRSDSELSHAADLPPMPEETPLQGVPSAAELISAQEARREKRARRKNLHLVEPGADPGQQAAAADASGAAEASPMRLASR